MEVEGYTSDGRKAGGEADDLMEEEYASILYVKPHKGDAFAITTDLSHARVKQLKEEIKKHTSIPVEQQRLLFQGKHLRNEQALLSDYGVIDESTVLLLQGITNGKRSPKHDWREKEIDDEDALSIDEEPLYASFFRALLMDEGFKHALKRGWELTEHFWNKHLFPFISLILQAVWTVISSYAHFTFLVIKFFVELFFITPIHFFFTLIFNLAIFFVGFVLATAAAILHYLFMDIPLLFFQTMWGVGWGICIEWPKKLFGFVYHKVGKRVIAIFKSVFALVVRKAWRVYPKKGRTSNNFTLGIVPGKLKQEQDGKTVYYMQPGQSFGVYLFNDNDFRVNCNLIVGGNDTGVFKMSPYAGYTIMKTFNAREDEYTHFVFSPKEEEGKMVVKAIFVPKTEKKTVEPHVLKVKLLPEVANLSE